MDEHSTLGIDALSQAIALREALSRLQVIGDDVRYLKGRVFMQGAEGPTMEKILTEHHDRLTRLENQHQSTQARIWTIVLDIAKLAIVAVGVYLLTQMFAKPPAPSVLVPPAQNIPHIP